MPTKAAANSNEQSLGKLPEWNLNDFYTSISDPDIEKDIKKADTLSKEFAKRYEGQLDLISADELAIAIRAYETITDLLGKIGSYAQLVYAQNMAKDENTQFYQNICEKLTEISTTTLFFSLEINKLDEVKLQQMQASNKALNHYAPWIRDTRSFRPYQLSDDLEKLLHEKTVTGKQAWQRLFDETLAGLRFPYEGKMLANAQIFDKLSSKDRDTRKKAAKAIGQVFEENGKIFAMVTNVLAKDKSIEDNLRQFPKPISSRNLVNCIEDEVVDALIHAVKKSYPKLSHRYYKLKAKWLGLDKLEYWDRNAPLSDLDDRRIPWDEAQNIVLSAYKKFSPAMATIGQDFFEKRWIDATVHEGKDSGAFSHPTVPSVHPYILLNYQGKSRDVMTLAHELGHGVHQVLSAKQGALMADTPLTLAETASVFGEQLTFQALLASQDDAEKRKSMIAAKVEDMLNTVVRQVAFCEYERKVHDERRQGEVPLERIGEIWMEVQNESLGSAFHFDKEYRHFWMYIPHFIHSPFYVYAYAFGDCLVNSLYAVYEQQPQGFEEKYITMLKAGGTLRHKELLAPFGLDASDPAFWQKGLDIISGFIDKLE